MHGVGEEEVKAAALANRLLLVAVVGVVGVRIAMRRAKSASIIPLTKTEGCTTTRSEVVACWNHRTVVVVVLSRIVGEALLSNHEIAKHV